MRCEVLQVKKIVEKRVSAWVREGFCSLNEEKKMAYFFLT